MRQQINLYQPSTVAMVRQVLSASTVLISGGLIIATLAAIAGYGAWEVSRLSDGVALVREHHRSQAIMRDASANAEGEVQSPEQVEAQNKTLRAELATRKRALQLLESGAAGKPAGFALRLEALGRRHIDGLWLDRLVLGSDAGMMSLAGSTLDPDLVPRYLQSLATDPALEGTRFDEFAIEQPNKAKNESGEMEDKPRVPANGLRFRATNVALSASITAAAKP
jgi:hypothetical protein